MNNEITILQSASTEIQTTYPSDTVAALIGRYIGEMNGTAGRRALRPLGDSHRYSLQAMQRKPIGSKVAKDLSRDDIKEHCLMRIETVCPATINQDMCYLSGVLDYAAAEWDECDGVSSAAIKAANNFLVKNNLIGKSTPRKRRPTGGELDALMTFFMEKDKDPRTKILMCELILFAVESTRRISEICRIKHGDIDWDHLDDESRPAPMYTVMDLKHPTKKKGNDKSFPILPGLAEIIRRQPRVNPDDPDERLFPFNSKSAGQAYTRAKKALGITNLRFHDNRREGTTRWLKILPPNKVRLITGHETEAILVRVYDGTKSESLHAEVAEITKAKQAAQSAA